MHLKPFKLERYFALYEFSTRYLLSSLDCDGLSQSELLEMADDRPGRDFVAHRPEVNIMLLPSTVYDCDDRHFKLGFGRENLPEALEKPRNIV